MATKKNVKRGASAKSVKRSAKPAKRVANKAPAKPPAPRTITPYLSLSDTASAIGWYKNVFGAKQVAVQPAPGGRIMHAHLKIGDSDLFMSDIFPGADLQDPSRVGASVSIHVWHRNTEKWWQNAVKNGAKVTMPLDDQFWGDRYGKFVDPFGHSWSLGWKSKLPKAALKEKERQAMEQFATMG